MQLSFGSYGIIGRSIAKGLIDIHSHNIRDYAANKHHNVDDTPYGGGMGMLMGVQPIFDCYDHIKNQSDAKNTRTIYMSPQGKVFDQKCAKRLSSYDRLII